MDEIIKSTDNRYSEYETLLFLRVNCEKKRMPGRTDIWLNLAI